MRKIFHGHILMELRGRKRGFVVQGKLYFYQITNGLVLKLAWGRERIIFSEISALRLLLFLDLERGINDL